MVKHIILWKLKEELTDVERNDAAALIKEKLEALVGVVPGLTKMKIRIEALDSSSADIMMDSELESQEALVAYQKHPAHLEVANGCVRPNVDVRLSMDYEV